MPRFYPLKGKRKTRDARLDRLPSFDERSRAFGAYALGKQRGLANQPPRSVTWRVPRILDQGTEGACVGFGIGGELAAAPVRVKRIDNRFCRERIYWAAQRSDEWPGGAYPGASPAYDGTSVLAGAKVAQKSGYITGYHWSFSLEELIYALSWLGPVVIGVNWYEGMFQTDANGFVQPTGQLMGGHCVYLHQHSLRGEYIGFPNSWGPDWGKSGFGKIRYGDLERLLAEDGEACVFEGRKGGR